MWAQKFSSQPRSKIWLLLHFLIGLCLHGTQNGALWASEGSRRILPPFEGECIEHARTRLEPRPWVLTWLVENIRFTQISYRYTIYAI